MLSGGVYGNNKWVELSSYHSRVSMSIVPCGCGTHSWVGIDLSPSVLIKLAELPCHLLAKFCLLILFPQKAKHNTGASSVEGGFHRTFSGVSGFKLGNVHNTSHKNPLPYTVVRKACARLSACDGLLSCRLGQ